MPPPSTSTRTPLAGTNKMSITCGYLHRAGLRLRRRLQLVQHQRLRLLPRQRLQLPLQRRLQLHRYCYSHSYGTQHHSYCYSQTDADAEICSQRRGPVPRHAPGQ